MLFRKIIKYKHFEDIKNEFEEGKLNRSNSEIQDCSICSLSLCIGNGKNVGNGENVQLVVYPHLFDIFEPKFFSFTKKGYDQAIDFYQEQIDEYLSKIEEEFYIEENIFSRLKNTSIS